MRIESFVVHRLFESIDIIHGELRGNVHVITGRNGAGKTSLLKLLWYVISGNIHLALREIEFSRVDIVTDLYKCTVHRINPFTCRVEISSDEGYVEYSDTFNDDGNILHSAEDLANVHIMSLGRSIFFPTFRRIEGGFTLGQRRRSAMSLNALGARAARNDIEEGLNSLSRQLSNEDHIFVASISTSDIVTLILQQYAELSELSNDLQKSVSQRVIDQIKSYKDRRDRGGSDAVIDDILREIESMDGDRAGIMAPFHAMTSLVGRLFQHSGIQIGERLSIGDAASAIKSDALSAGEKQMLSFIAYNAFYRDAVFFIDEPELSLHVDWQRQLFPVLNSQSTGNQFIVATHSPFIYGRYPDAEIMIGSGRGADIHD